MTKEGEEEEDDDDFDDDEGCPMNRAWMSL